MCETLDLGGGGTVHFVGAKRSPGVLVLLPKTSKELGKAKLSYLCLPQGDALSNEICLSIGMVSNRYKTHFS